MCVCVCHCVLLYVCVSVWGVCHRVSLYVSASTCSTGVTVALQLLRSVVEIVGPHCKGVLDEVHTLPHIVSTPQYFTCVCTYMVLWRL